MPTYDYRCDACGHTFEEFQSMNDKPFKKCPQCKKSKLVRLFGAGAAIIFKGTGFYQTDYRSESYKSAAKADSKPSESSAPAKSETSASGDTSSAAAKPAAPSSSTEGGSKSSGKKSKS